MVAEKRIKKLKKQVDHTRDLPIPSDDRIIKLCSLLQEDILKDQTKKKYAPVKHILVLLGVGAVLGLSMLSPPVALVVKPFLDEKRRQERDEWKRYNTYFLRRSIKRLQKQKYVEIKEQNGEQIVTLTKNGRRRILKYALNNLTIQKPKRWDDRWRLILYDVQDKKKQLRDVFRHALRSLGFYQLQESAWLYPYPCEEQISFLREYYDVGNEVIYIVATKLEDDTPYKTYFGLD